MASSIPFIPLEKKPRLSIVDRTQRPHPCLLTTYRFNLERRILRSVEWMDSLGGDRKPEFLYYPGG